VDSTEDIFNLYDIMRWIALNHKVPKTKELPLLVPVLFGLTP
jgi:hypothetical protein